VTQCAQSRARKTIFKNCHFRGNWNYPSGSATAQALDFYAAECQALDCIFEGFWQGIGINRPTDGGGSPDIAYADDCVIDGNLFWRVSEYAIENKSAGDNTVITNNTFVDCGREAPDTVIEFPDAPRTQTSTGHVIRGNTISKNRNTYSIETGSLLSADITIEGNTMTGYGTQVLGINGTDSANIENDYSGLNFTDGGFGTADPPTTFDAGDVSSTDTLDFATNGVQQRVRLTGNWTPADPTDPTSGTDLIIEVTQDATGGHTVSFASWPVEGPEPAINGAANSTTAVRVYYGVDNEYHFAPT
jgi:hypothetical protein